MTSFLTKKGPTVTEKLMSLKIPVFVVKREFDADYFSYKNVSLEFKTLAWNSKDSEIISFNHSHKKRIVWKHGPNRPIYALMLRTKLYSNPFFFTGDQNVNKPKSRTARTVYTPIFLPFYKIIVSFFFFFLSRYKQSKIEL